MYIFNHERSLQQNQGSTRLIYHENKIDIEVDTTRNFICKFYYFQYKNVGPIFSLRCQPSENIVKHRSSTPI